jgi:excisionase family DNA binding protein
LSQSKNAETLSSANPESDINDPYIRLLTKPEIGQIIGKSMRSVDNMMRRRQIPFIRIGRNVRFKLAAVEKALEKLTVKEVSI